MEVEQPGGHWSGWWKRRSLSGPATEKERSNRDGPKDRQFHKLTDEGLVEETGEPVPVTWPKFTEGKVVEVKGVPFKVQRINRSTLVLRPVLQGGFTSARRMMDRYRG